MPNKILLSAGYMCDMSFCADGPISEDDSKNAFIHNVDGVRIFNSKKFYDWLAPLAPYIDLHRIALYCVGGDLPRSKLFMPWGFVPDRDAWDLRVKNQVFFDILRQMAVLANKLKVQLEVCIMNECEERKATANNEGPRRAQSPMFHNVNGFAGLYDRKALPFITTLTDWILEAVEGTDFAIEFINEGHRRGSGSPDAINAMLPSLIKADVKPWDISVGADVLDSALVGFKPVGDWATRWPNELQPPSEHPNPIQPIGKENYDLFIDRNHLVKYYDAKYPKATHQAFFSICHNFADKADKDFPAMFPYGRRTGYTIEAWIDRNLSSNRVIFSTDGTDNADLSNGRPSAARWKAAILYVLRFSPRYKASPLIDGRPKLRFDYLPSRQTTAQIAEICKAGAEAYKEFFGVALETKVIPTYEELYPEQETPPDIIIDDEEKPDDKVVESLLNWQGWLNNRIAWVKSNWGWVAGAILVLWLFFKVAC